MSTTQINARNVATYPVSAVIVLRSKEDQPYLPFTVLRRHPITEPKKKRCLDSHMGTENGRESTLVRVYQFAFEDTGTFYVTIRNPVGS